MQDSAPRPPADRMDILEGVGTGGVWRAAGAMVGAVLRYDLRRALFAIALNLIVAFSEGATLALVASLIGDALGGGVTLAPFAHLDTAALLGLIGALMIVAAVLGWWRSRAIARLRLDFLRDLQMRAHSAALSLSLRRLGGWPRAELTHLVTADLARAGQAAHFLFNGVVALTRLPALGAIAVALSPVTAVVAAFAALILAALGGSFVKAARVLGGAQGRTNARAMRGVDESLTNLILIKTHKAESRRMAQYEALTADGRSVQLQFEHVQANARLFGMVMGGALTALTAWLALTAFGESPATVLALAMLLLRLLPAVSQTQASWRQLVAATPSHARVSALIALSQSEGEQAVPAAPRRAAPAALRLEGVDIARGLPGAPPVIGGLDLTLESGGVTALMGRSGVGKSTLGLALCGLNPIERGRVLLDGEAMPAPHLMALRALSVLVPQEPMLFNATIAENLRYAAPEASDDELRAALIAVGAGFALRGEGLAREVGDRGGALSGGERQRLALAQALLARPPLLVLDEATSALDEDSERVALGAILALRGVSTIFLITHRRMVAAMADRAFVMTAGGAIAPMALDETDAFQVDGQ